MLKESGMAGAQISESFAMCPKLSQFCRVHTFQRGAANGHSTPRAVLSTDQFNEWYAQFLAWVEKPQRVQANGSSNAIRRA